MLELNSERPGQGLLQYHRFILNGESQGLINEEKRGEFYWNRSMFREEFGRLQYVMEYRLKLPDLLRKRMRVFAETRAKIGKWFPRIEQEREARRKRMERAKRRLEREIPRKWRRKMKNFATLERVAQEK